MDSENTQVPLSVPDPPGLVSWPLVDIREIDLADDAAHGARCTASTSRSSHLGRESMPHWTHQEFLGAYRSGDSGERQVVLGAYDGDTLLGFAGLWFPLLDNLDKVYLELHVDPPARRRGVGRALVDELEARARADGRTLLLTDSKIPAGERETHPYRRFAEACGFELSNVEVVRHLALPVPDERLQAWADKAAERHEGYTIETYVDEFPDDLAESLCLLHGPARRRRADRPRRLRGGGVHDRAAARSATRRPRRWAGPSTRRSR